MRAFANKGFSKFAHDECISDASLRQAAMEIVAGTFDADLKGYLYKKRIGRTGQGKRGGYRLIVGYRAPKTERVVFVFGFAKSATENITDAARDVFSLASQAFISASDAQVAKLIAERKYREIFE